MYVDEEGGTMIGECCVSEATAERGNEPPVQTTRTVTAKTLTEEVDVAIIGERLETYMCVYILYTLMV